MTRKRARYEEIIAPLTSGAVEVRAARRPHPVALAGQIEEIIGSARERGLPGQTEPHRLLYG